MKRYATIGFGLMSGAALYFAPAAMACSCGGDAAFVQSAPSMEVVIRGKVLDHRWAESDIAHQHPYSMTVEVKEFLKGQTKSQRLTISGGAGLLCRPEISSFPIDSEWVFALYPAIWDGDKRSELAISSCGQNSLVVQGNTVKGKVTQTTNADEAVSLPNLRKLVKTPPKIRRSASNDALPRKCADRVTKAGV
jgi:hypothetical protein